MFIGKVAYPIWAKRDHPAYQKYAKLFNREQFVSASELHDLQMERLRHQLAHAYKNIPFYRRRMDEAGLTPFDINSFSDFRKLPLLTKRDIQDHQTELLSPTVPESKREINQTGGSTGSPLQFWVDKERFDARRASTDRHNAWAGLRPGDWCAQLWGAQIDVGTSTMPQVSWRTRLLHRVLPLNTSRVTRESLAAYVKLLRKYRPRHMVAYAQAAVMFAGYCKEIGADDIQFDSIITTAEVLLPEQRTVLEEIFGGKVFNRYGCREVSVIASECEHHTGMHVNADALLVEIEPVAGLPGGMGRVVVTDLFNRSMPLIRYEIGDFASWTDGEPCPCGRSLPRLDHIEGRATDFLRMPDGTLVSGPALTLVIKDMPEIRQVQFIQRGPTKVHLNIVVKPGNTSTAVEELRTRLFPYFRDAVEISTSLVENIPCEASGKYRFVKTEYDIPRVA
jgi:phenylacetate-CoA ligase